MGTRKSGQPCSKELLSVLNCISDTQGKTEGCEKAILAMQMCLEGAKVFFLSVFSMVSFSYRLELLPSILLLTPIQ